MDNEDLFSEKWEKNPFNIKPDDENVFELLDFSEEQIESIQQSIENAFMRFKFLEGSYRSGVRSISDIKLFKNNLMSFYSEIDLIMISCVNMKNKCFRVFFDDNSKK